jgi:hypothetical protein
MTTRPIPNSSRVLLPTMAEEHQWMGLPSSAECHRICAPPYNSREIFRGFHVGTFTVPKLAQFIGHDMQRRFRFDCEIVPISVGEIDRVGLGLLGGLPDKFRRLSKSQVHSTSRAEAQQRMYQKLATPAFSLTCARCSRRDRARALTEEALKAAFTKVMMELSDRIPGDEWAKADEMRGRFGL